MNTEQDTKPSQTESATADSKSDEIETIELEKVQGGVRAGGGPVKYEP